MSVVVHGGWSAHGRRLSPDRLGVINPAAFAVRVIECPVERKRKEEYLYSAIYTTHSLKELRHGSHSFTCKLYHACLSFVSVHQMAPPLIEVADIQLLIYRPKWGERLSWPG